MATGKNNNNTYLVVFNFLSDVKYTIVCLSDLDVPLE